MITETSPLETRQQPTSRFARRVFTTSLVAGLALAAFPPKAVDKVPVHATGLSDCAPYFDTSRYHNHEYEVCTAYIANSAEIALQGFYKYGNNRVSYLADAARHHFKTRYWAGPRRTIEREVDSWPTTRGFTGNRVREDIDLVSLSSNLKADRGVLRTRENWRVTSPTGRILHDEPRHIRNVTMCRGRLPGHPLHAWFVVKFSRDPSFDCITFDKRHNLQP